MDNAIFWDLIATTRTASGNNISRQIGLLTQELTEFPVEEIEEFDLIFREFFCASNTWNLWGAAYIVLRGCSDDMFDYFRGWLVAQGEAVFLSVWLNPEHLLEVVDGQSLTEVDYEGQQMLNVARSAYQLKTGEEEMPRMPIPCGVIGEEWSEEDLPTKYPKLWAKYGW